MARRIIVSSLTITRFEGQDLDAAVRQFMQARRTGTLVLNVSQGHISNVEWQEREGKSLVLPESCDVRFSDGS